MKLFLTSSPGCVRFDVTPPIPCAMDSSNGFTNRLKSVWPDNAAVLIISSHPDDFAQNDDAVSMHGKSLNLTGLPFSHMTILDSRNAEKAAELVSSHNVLFLSGGHVPTENEFFTRIGLRELIKDYDGVVIGISAGTMNSADVVYAQPELPGEAVDPDYKRYLTGLGITGISVLPHFQELRGLSLDGLRILEDICLPDSEKRPFYALVDGSYIYSDGGRSILYGEGYLFSGGKFEKICGLGESIIIEN